MDVDQEKRPGHRYVLQQGMPSTPSDLEDYVIGYANFLLEETSPEKKIPVSLDSVLDHFQIEKQELHLDGDRQGLKFSGKKSPYQTVFVEKGDKRQRKRFSLAHELIELLFEALHQGVLSTKMEEASIGFRKERLCEIGAAALLMPEEVYSDKLDTRATTIKTASELAQVFEVSLLASLIRMVELSEENHLLIAWREKLKPKQRRRHTESQLSLSFEEPTGPEEKLRVEWSRWTNHPSDWHVPRNKSVPENSLIQEAFQDKKRLVGTDRLILGDSFGGTFEMEVLPVQLGTDQWVISLLNASGIE